MIRYIATAVVAVLLLAVALVLRSGADAAGTTPEAPRSDAVVERPDSLDVRPVAAGVEVSVRHAFAGSLSRASLVYELDGQERTADATTTCAQELLAGSKVRGRAGHHEVALKGLVPHGARAVRLILESEVGTEQIPVPVE